MQRVEKRLTHQCNSDCSAIFRCAFGGIGTSFCCHKLNDFFPLHLPRDMLGLLFRVGQRLETAWPCEMGASSGLWHETRWCALAREV